MAELFGWAGKILFVNLSTKTTNVVPTSNYVPKWFGGRALASKLYWDTVPPSCAAFDPENAVIFATGPASGTLAPGHRTAIISKSPEVVPESYNYSVTGGHWSAELKFAGYDAVVVTGKSPRPSYILIRDEKVEIKEADRLWGMTTYDTDKEIMNMWGDSTRSMLIGPAGENMVRTAVILTDGSHATGMGGFGAVMGSKNLKAVAVQGTSGVKVAKPQELIKFYDENVKIGGKYGGPYIVSSDQYNPMHFGLYPATEDIDTAFNAVDSFWAKNHWLMYGEVNAGTIRRKFAGCFACPSQCGYALLSLDPTGKEPAPENLNVPMIVGQQCHELQYNSDWEWKAFKDKCMGRTAISYCAYDQLYGISSHVFGDNYNWFMDAVGLGLLTPENTGLPVKDLNGLNSPAMIGKEGYAYGMTYGTSDFFKKVSEGPQRFLEGKAKESAAWKDMYDRYIQAPRYHNYIWGTGSKGSTSILGQATCMRRHPNEPSLTGTGKTVANFIPAAKITAARAALLEKYTPSLGPKHLTANTWDDKIKVNIFQENMCMEYDSLPMCGWAGFPRFYSIWTPDNIGNPGVGAQAFSAVTGVNRTMDENLAAMEAPWTMERAIHAREGRRKEHDYYNDLTFSLTKWTTKEEFGKKLSEYYVARGWNGDTGVPTRSQLEKLGMKDVADDLVNKYKVPVSP
jgi:aldehyde:ferredoxin oxidoreductase